MARYARLVSKGVLREINVCAGEPWVHNQSTLLQVVVSIQAMILCEKPWYNEPAHGSSYDSESGNDHSAAYNQYIRQHTIHTAILGWLDQPPPLWKDVLGQHFTANADKVLQTAIDWSKSQVQAPHRSSESAVDDGVPSPLAAQLLQRLEKALQKYGASQIVSKISEPATQDPGNGRARRSVAQNFNLPYNTMMLPYPTPPPMNPPSPYVLNQSYPHTWFEALGGHASNTYQSFVTGVQGGTSRGRGGAFANPHNTSRGRYATGSSSRGRGGSILATNTLGLAGHMSSNFPSNNATQRGSTSSPPFLGGFTERGRDDRGIHTDRGRGGRGRGELTDRGRGGRGKRIDRGQGGR
jgi:hypothetical protein